VVRAGGALLAAAAAADHADVVAVTAIGPDAAGRELRALAAAAGVELVDLGLDGPTPEKIRLRAGSQTVARIDRASEPAGVRPLTAAGRAAIDAADAVLVADYGRGLVRRPDVRRALGAAATRIPLTWDPHRLGPRPLRASDLATPNEAEARAALGLPPEPVGASGPAAAADLAHRLHDLWRCPVAVTAGPLGAALAGGNGPVELVPTVATAGDPCGAGDHLAAAYTVARALGTDRAGALRAAVLAASGHVAGHVRSLGRLGPSDATELARRVRDRGGVVVAAGGCFDILHAGHVSLLERARALGDCLIVCLNDDRSVRRLKGPGRPVNGAADRAAVLQSLGCVDAVEIFEDDTPCTTLGSLRPHLFVKGSDYGGAPLPEEAAMEPWAGRVVLLAVESGRSTTRVIQRAAEATA
jgi:rfaE bifunctional protein nucleotidyltransferase chain/domain